MPRLHAACLCCSEDFNGIGKAARPSASTARDPGYAPLLLRLTTGYGSPEVLNDFRSVAIVEYALVDPNSHRYILEGKIDSIDKPKGPTYFSWSALLQDASAARSQIRTSLLQTGDAVPSLIFSFDKS